MQIRSLLIFIICVFACHSSIISQNSDNVKSISSTYFIKNTTVIVKPGEIKKNQDIILRNGIIDQIGKQLKVPHDAKILNFDSLYVYAGFIDGYSSAGIPKQESKDRPKVENPGSPPNDIAGITPELSVYDMIKADESSITDLRNAGFCITNVANKGKMLPGYSSLLLTNNLAVEKSIIKNNFAQNFAYNPVRGVYPSTLIGVMASFREIMTNTKIYSQNKLILQNSKETLPRLHHNEVYEALEKVAAKNQSLLVSAPKSKDIYRSLLLQKEFDLSLILVNVKEPLDYLSNLSTKKIPVFLSLEIPENPTKSNNKRDSTSINEPNELHFEQKQKDSYAAIEKYPSALSKQKMGFGISTMNGKVSKTKDIFLKWIEHGLTEDEALASLTTYPANVFGINQYYGSVEKGKYANLVVTDMPYFSKEAKIKYVFIDGFKFDVSSEKVKKTTADSLLIFNGTWEYSMVIEGAKQTARLQITQKKDDCKVRVSAPGTNDEFTEAYNISIDKSSLTFDVDNEKIPGGKASFSLHFEGDSFKGQVTVMTSFTLPIDGSKIADPKIN